jgi:sugar-specific transcriptional regulator TrmB
MIPKTNKKDMIKTLDILSKEFDNRAAKAEEDSEHWDWVIRARALEEIREEFESLINSLDEIRNVPLWDEYRCIEIANHALRDYD